MRRVYCIILAGMLAACGGNSTETTETPITATEAPVSTAKKSTLIFLDKSLSVNEDKAFVEKKYGQAINELVKQNITKAGDELDVWLIHENTAKGKALDLMCRTTMESTEGMSPTDVEAAQTNYDLSMQKERLSFASQIMKQLATPNASRSNRQTDIQASLEAIQEQVASGNDVNAYFFSDMVESMESKDRRDFHHKPPKTSDVATQWAKADARKLKSRYPNLTSVNVFMVLPFEPTSSSKANNPNVTLYWKTFFKELGVKKVEEII